LNKLEIKISKFLSYILRHNTKKYDLKIDSKGYVDLDLVLNILNERFQNTDINKEYIEKIIKKSEKRRFEILENKIRAFYGHTLENKIRMVEAKFLPKKLYHGTNPKAFEKIKIEGLKRKKRQYVHLSSDIETAIKVGKRRTSTPLILVINVEKAKQDGILFYKSGDMYLADFIPKRYISILQ
jgi:putative RNA 2'-phosphotransferase